MHETKKEINQDQQEKQKIQNPFTIIQDKNSTLTLKINTPNSYVQN